MSTEKAVDTQLDQLQALVHGLYAALMFQDPNLVKVGLGTAFNGLQGSQTPTDIVEHIAKTFYRDTPASEAFAKDQLTKAIDELIAKAKA